MRNLIIFISIFCLATMFSTAQEFGFLGKKNVVSVYGTGNPRILTGVVIPLESTDGGHKYIQYDEDGIVDRKIKMFRYDIRASYKRMLKRNMAIGVEVGYEKYNLTYYSYSQYTTIPDNPANNYYTYNNLDDYYIESPQFNVF